jgi:hypothetical protein
MAMPAALATSMATVYLAQDLKHDRKVAIKILKPELAAVIGEALLLNHQHMIVSSAHADASGAERNRPAIQVILGAGRLLPF